MKLLRTLFIILLLILSFRLGRHSAEGQDEIIETRVDTVVFYHPQPIRTSDLEVSINVPKWLFASQPVTDCHALQYNKEDTVSSATQDGKTDDSVRMQIVERTLEYRDSTYFARVIGPVVGSMAPRLDFIETYDVTTTRILRKVPRWDVGIEAGVDLRNCWAGAYVTRNFGRLSLSADAGYDPFRKEPRLEIRSKVSIWQPSR